MREARFTVTLSRASTSEVEVDYQTNDGTAVAPEDYTAKSGKLVFAPGELTKTISVICRDTLANVDTESFSVSLSGAVNAVLSPTASTGTATLVGDLPYLDRFHWIYDNLHNPANGYFGPPSGPNARTVPYHSIETLICEAPDWGHETVSETVSFYVGLTAFKGLLDDDWTDYNKCWDLIDRVYVPSDVNQPIDVYNPSSPADYTPEGDLPSAYPTLGDPDATKGVDGLADELETTYGEKQIYLMHWIIDVDGAYGFHNGDGATVNTYINNYQRGLQESAWETVPHPEWEDFQFGNQYGYLPIFSQGAPTYPAAANEYGKQYRYTCAPDAEGRAVQYAFWADKWARESGKVSSIGGSNTRAKKMGDYLRYCLMDKYFRQIGDNRALGSTEQDPYTACHYLISWYVSWGGMVPNENDDMHWSFRIGSSECHQGYQCPNIAYYMATGGGGYAPQSPSAGDIWLGSMYRQLEMIRWLQTEKGLIAGGVSNSWKGRYETPADGREDATFYGMHYTYAPVWHDPPSNNWFGFQTWGLQRTAELFLELSDKTGLMQSQVRTNCAVILDRFVNWVLANVSIDTLTGEFEVPDNLRWTSTSEVVGRTTHTPNLEGVYEYIPTNSWDGTGDHGEFWSGSSVPNPSLDFEVATWGKDLGTTSTLSFLLILYAEAKRRMGLFETTIPNNPNGGTPSDALSLARGLLDGIWIHYRDDIGITRPEARGDYSRYFDPIYVPSNYNGQMPNGDPINSNSTFISIRSWQMDDPDWYRIQDYHDDPAEGNVPTFTYHRFWAQCEYAMACGAMHHYFNDII